MESANSKTLTQTIAGWLVFAIAMTVYYLTAERTGSLWDCGEFILGAYKLQVVHPPGAPLFVLVGRLFTWIAEVLSDDPADIAFAVNLMSGMCTAFAAAFVAWTTMMLGRLALVGRDRQPDAAEDLAVAGAGLVAGLCTAFATSVWFSAVEGEVYAMSTFFSALTIWAAVKWYSLPDDPQHDRWLLFSVYAAGLSIGVHLLSLLAFPALALFYYFKKYKNHTFIGLAASALVGVIIVAAVQRLVIVGIPMLWSQMELVMVNGLGLPVHTGLIPTLLIVAGILYAGLRYAHSVGSQTLQHIVFGAALVVISFSTIGVVVIRANVHTPINMNAPTDAMRLIPYLNREQYGERALLRGPSFEGVPESSSTEDRYGLVGNRYEYVDYKVNLEYRNKDKMLFPRISDGTQGRPAAYKRWLGLDPRAPMPPGRPNQGDNLRFFLDYQINWMYFRYFMWNFSGRQNGEQGYYAWDKSSGHWITGIDAFDSWRLDNQSRLTDVARENKSRNAYFALPFLFGLLGMFFHFKKRSNDALALMALFIITGIGIIIYSNQPPNEPRERDYVLVGSFFTYAMWIGMAVLALFDLLRRRLGQSGMVSAILAGGLILVAPVLMGTQNFDDHDRSEHYASRDYAHNFLESCEPNSIIFTYGDNDTYPLWYAQEVEGIRTDVRVVNLSLIAVDWYIDLLRRKINNSPPLKMTIPAEALRGKLRNQVFYYNPSGNERPVTAQELLRFIGGDNPLQAASGRKIDSHYNTTNVVLPVDREAALRSGAILPTDTAIMANIPLRIPKDQMIKDDIAILDVITSNLWERPIYFAVTCRPEKMFGLEEYMQLEGLGVRIVPIRSRPDPQYGVIGNGRVNVEKNHDLFMNRFRWGNFDKADVFVDRSYFPSVQSIQLSLRRTALAFLSQGEKEKALQLADRYFEVFPDMNFPYDYRTMYILPVYFQAEAFDRAKPHIEILAKRCTQSLEFYMSLRPETIETSFAQESSATYDVMETLIREARRAQDDEMAAKLEAMFKPYRVDDINDGIPPMPPIDGMDME